MTHNDQTFTGNMLVIYHHHRGQYDDGCLRVAKPWDSNATHTLRVLPVTPADLPSLLVTRLGGVCGTRAARRVVVAGLSSVQKKIQNENILVRGGRHESRFRYFITESVIKPTHNSPAHTCPRAMTNRMIVYYDKNDYRVLPRPSLRVLPAGKEASVPRGARVVPHAQPIIARLP